MSKVVIDVTVVRVKPKYWQEYKQGIPSGAALWQRHGAKLHGIFLTEAGPSNEIVYVTEWRDLDTRLNALAKIHQDPEYAKMRERQRFIVSKESYLCFARSKCPIKPFPTNERIMMKKYNLKGNSYLCENKFLDMVCYRSSHDSSSKGPLAVLHPVSASNFGMLVFFAQPGGSIDAGQEHWYKFVSDPKNWPKINEAYQHYTEKSSRILKPFQHPDLHLDGAKKSVIDVTVVKVKPKYWQEYKQGVPSGSALWQKHGAKLLGIFLTEAGPSNEIIYVNEWRSLDARLNALATIHQDPEYAKMKERQHFIYGKETYLCYARSRCPVKSFPTNERIMMKKYNLHGNSYLCENKFLDMVCYRSSHDSSSKGPLAVLHPVAASNFGLLVFFAQPNGSIDAGQENWYKFVSDPHNWPKLTEAYTKYSEKSSRILKPFKA